MQDDNISRLLSSAPDFKFTDNIQSVNELNGEIGFQLNVNVSFPAMAE